MIFKKRSEIMCLIITVLFVLSGLAAAEGEWASSDESNIYNTNPGNVGIGTTNPAGGLHVFHGNPTKLFIGHDSSSGQVARAAVIEKQTSSPYHSDFYWSNNPTSNAGDLTFYSSRNTPRAIFKANGNVGIGTANPGNYKLNVAGTIRAEEIIVNTSGADYVFSPEYKLTSLADVEQHIKEKRRLPDIPSSKEAQSKGIGVAQMQTKLLEKIEELTLYLIDMKKENDELKKRVEILETYK